MSLKDIKPALELSQELQDSLGLTLRRSLEEGLEDLYMEKAARDGYAKDYDKHSSPYRQWLAEHPGESIEDPEKGFTAYLQPNGTDHVYDIPDAVEKRLPELYRRLIELGCLAWDVRRIEQAIKDGLLSAGDVLPIRSTQLRTPHFKVDKAT